MSMGRWRHIITNLMTIDSSTIYNTTYRIYTSPAIGLRLLQRELYNFDEVCREDSPAAVYRTSPPLRNEQMSKKEEYIVRAYIPVVCTLGPLRDNNYIAFRKRQIARLGAGW
jgi:hypothetical protein